MNNNQHLHEQCTQLRMFIMYESVFNLNIFTFLHVKQNRPPKGGTPFHSDHYVQSDNESWNKG